MSTDQLKDLFEGLREEAVPTIRPPGAAAARKTVRRRRNTKAVLSAAAAVLAVTGGVAVFERRSSPPPVVASPTVSTTSAPVVTDPKELAKVAQRALTGANPAVDVAVPVEAGYRKEHGIFLGDLTLQAACAGPGRFELTVDGQENRKTEWRLVKKMWVQCSAEPVPVSTTFAMTSPYSYYRFRLANVVTNAVNNGKSGFAYRVTSNTGVPIRGDSSHQEIFNTDRRLDLSGRRVRSAASGRIRVSPPTFELAPQLRTGRYTLVAKCAGTGTALFVVRQGGKVVTDFRVPCAWPAGPQREVALGRLDRTATVHTGYESTTPADALITYALAEE
ncbi:hypothetical protein AB0G04_17520 [Actinoplanes sp. NPDC023801]|uniref:hypothetical protein n=1 Tax=Actinoplanes sp. NPDC023801 TaxID=3154595 RepID=UPI003410A6FC